MNRLPLELWWHICTYLPSLHSLLSFVSVNSCASSLLTKDEFWRCLAPNLCKFHSWNYEITEFDASRFGWKLATRKAVERSLRLGEECVRRMKTVQLNSIQSYEPFLSGDLDEMLLVQIGVVGECGVGKSSLVHRFFTDRMDAPRVGTSSACPWFYDRVVTVSGTPLCLRCQSTFPSWRWGGNLGTSSYREDSAFLFCFDLTARETFVEIQRMMKSLLDSARLCDISQLNAFIVGTKLDLEERTVERIEGEELAQKFEWKYFETSARTKEGLEELFAGVAQLTLRKYRSLDSRPSSSLEVSPFFVRLEQAKTSEKWCSIS